MSITVQAPDGAVFEFEEVKTNRGQVSLGEQPLLVWKDLGKAVEYYGEDNVLSVLDGTSFRVSFQGIARRMAAAGKSADEIADTQLKFRPGKRSGVGAPTPVSRARKSAEAAASVLGDKADLLTEIMQKIANGTISAEELEALNA